MNRGSMGGRFWQILLGFFLLLLGLSSIGGDQTVTLFLGLLGFYLISRQFSSSTNGDARSRDRRSSRTLADRGLIPSEDIDIHVERQSISDPDMLPHAVTAARLAGIEPTNALVAPLDIGLMSFGEDGEPIIHRTTAIDQDSVAIQPYLHLRLARRAEGRIRFEIVDALGKLVFVHEDRYPLDTGVNLISPRARLPITHASAFNGDWKLRVYADDVPIALHHFGWFEDTSKAIRRHLDEDGEISAELRALMAENRLGKLSLDELLGEQIEDQLTDPARIRRGRSS